MAKKGKTPDPPKIKPDKNTKAKDTMEKAVQDEPKPGTTRGNNG